LTRKVPNVGDRRGSFEQVVRGEVDLVVDESRAKSRLWEIESSSCSTLAGVSLSFDYGIECLGFVIV
jgi:hypothetical protein